MNMKKETTGKFESLIPGPVKARLKALMKRIKEVLRE